MSSIISGVDFYFRNNSTGRPTKTHIINPKTGYSYCGYKDDPFAEDYPKEYWSAHRMGCCKTCLKMYDKLKDND